jgi:hypothetical protein
MDVGQAVKEFYSNRDQVGWLMLTMDKSNALKVHGQGDSMEELQDEWDQSRELFVLLRVIEPISQLPKIVLISWVYQMLLYNWKLDRQLFAH